MKLPENKLSEITFHLIVDSAPNAVFLVNQAGIIAYVNRQCEILFGYSTQELIGKSIEMLVPERFRARHGSLRKAFAKAPSMRSMGSGLDLYGLRKNRSEFPIEIGLNPMVLVDGMWVLATVIDITERKQSEERFQKVVESAPNAMFLVNRQGEITLVNQQAKALFGYGERELIGKPIEMLVPSGPSRTRHGALRDAFFYNPQTRYMGAGRDLTGMRKDGTEIPIEIGLNPIHTSNGLMVLASVVDITERRVQAELRSKKEAAEAASKAKSELLAIASHDLKNPLASIAGLAEVLLEMKQNEEGASQQDIEFIQTIRDASKHMSELVQGILANEGFEQQGMTLHLESVDVSGLCNELIRFNEPSAQRKQIRLIGQIAPGIRLQADRTRLREAFDNYLSNAIKYSPPEKSVTVSLALIDGGEQIEFGVRDEGPGLTDDDKNKAFGKFKKLSAKPTGGESSTGLGLSIVKAIVEKHHGTTGCDSEPERGAYFWARLPAASG